jgi:hypothetical protein
MLEVMDMLGRTERTKAIDEPRGLAFSGGGVSTVARLGVCWIGYVQHLDPGGAESY